MLAVILEVGSQPVSLLIRIVCLSTAARIQLL